MKGYYKLMPVRKLDEATVRHARANFARFRLAGTITEGSFESSVWKVNDELHEHEFCFEMDEAVFYTHAGTWMGCTFPCFETSVRAYAALNLGTFSASTLMQIIGAFRDLAGMDYESLGDIRGDMRAHAAELLRLIPEGADWRDIARFSSLASIRLRSTVSRLWLVSFTSRRLTTSVVVTSTSWLPLSSAIPSDLNTYGGEAKRLLEDLQSRNERMFLVTVIFLNTAKTKQELDAERLWRYVRHVI